MLEVRINLEDCTNCMECIEVCPEEVLELVGGRPTRVYPERCLGCQSCLNICPENAIRIFE